MDIFFWDNTIRTSCIDRLAANSETIELINKQLNKFFKFCFTQNKPYLFTKTNSKTVMSDFTDEDDDDSSHGDFPPTAAVALAVSLTAVVVIVVTIVWRGRKSRRRPEASRLLYAPGPHKPRI